MSERSINLSKGMYNNYTAKVEISILEFEKEIKHLPIKKAATYISPFNRSNIVVFATLQSINDEVFCENS